MAAPTYNIPGQSGPSGTTGASASPGAAADARAAADAGQPQPRTVADVLSHSHAGDVLDELDRDLVGLAPVKSRIRDIAALLVIDKLRMNLGLQAQAPSLHMSFTGNPGTGKTTVAMRMAEILHRLGYVRKGHLVAVTRDDLVGQYIGHTAPKTKEVLKRAMGGVLFIDEAYYLYRPENERDYGQEAIEILLQVMENQRDDLVVILAGYKDRMDTFFRSNPGLSSRIAHHLDFPDYEPQDLLAIADKMLAAQNYHFGPGAPRGLRGISRGPHQAAAFRQRPQRAQCPRSLPAAPGQPAVLGPQPGIHRRGPDHARPNRISARAACSSSPPTRSRLSPAARSKSCIWDAQRCRSSSSSN